jgi:hypothetical protein
MTIADLVKVTPEPKPLLFLRLKGKKVNYNTPPKPLYF